MIESILLGNIRSEVVNKSKFQQEIKQNKLLNNNVNPSQKYVNINFISSEKSKHNFESYLI